MLLCYDLPVHVGKDGKPISRFLASRGRSFQQMLVALIHEVSAVGSPPAGTAILRSFASQPGLHLLILIRK